MYSCEHISATKYASGARDPKPKIKVPAKGARDAPRASSAAHGAKDSKPKRPAAGARDKWVKKTLPKIILMIMF